MKSFLIKNFLLVVIMAIAAVLRFWQLGQNPPGLFADEASNGYNAYSILKTGRDEYGNFLPLTFRAFGDYNPAFSVYLLVPSIAIFGLNEFAVRFPSALLGTLTIPFTYLLVRKLFSDDSHRKLQQGRLQQGASLLGLLAAFFLAISPWHLQFSRYDHEANFMLFFSVLAVTLFLYSLKKSIFLPLSAFSFALAINSYQGAKIWIPILMLLILVIFYKEIRKFGTKLFLPATIMIISLLPILTNFKQSLIRGNSVGIIQTEKPLNTFISNYLSHYSPNFLFVEGDLIGRHSISGMGELFVFQIPLVVLGLLALVRLQGKSKSFVLGWLLLAPVPAALTSPAPHALRSISATLMWSIICALGIYALISVKIKNLQKVAVFTVIISVAIYNFVTYLHLYYAHYPKLKASDWQDGYKQMVQFVNGIKDNYEVIAITNYYTKPYIFVLFYTKYDPATYQRQSQDKSKFDKFEFFGASWEKKVAGTVLLVRPHWQKPDPPPKYIKEIYDSANTLVFRISEE